MPEVLTFRQRHTVARTAAPSGGMVLALEEFKSPLAPLSPALQKHWPEKRPSASSLPRHARRLAAGVPSVPRHRRAARTILNHGASASSRASQSDVIYYSGDELPQTQDRGGAQAGKSGRAGGSQAHHRTQTIRVARGDKPTEKIVDAPKLNLPHSDSAVANLLAFKPNPGPPPAEGLRSAHAAPTLPQMTVVAPSPELTPSSNRNALKLPSDVIAPRRCYPHPIAHCANLKRCQHRRARARCRARPDANRDPFAPTIIAPAPREAQRDLASSRMPLTQNADVVAPPVSAPPRDVSSTSKLSMPAPAVVAPPPSQVSRDLDSWGGSATGDLQAKPVPPPPSASGGGSLARSSGTGLTPQVVPPPASIGGAAQANGSRSVIPQALSLVPPTSSRSTRSRRRQSTLRQRTRQQRHRSRKSARPGFRRSSSDEWRRNRPGSGVVVSSQPGSKVGLPNSTGAGAIAMSPTGTAKTGLGAVAPDQASAKATVPAADCKAKVQALAGKAPAAAPTPTPTQEFRPTPARRLRHRHHRPSAMSGVSVEGGTTTITLPSFGTPAAATPRERPGRSSTNIHGAPGYTVKATSSSGGVFNRYGQLKGDNYSIYIETSLGMAVMQYADPASAVHAYSGDLTAPAPSATTCLGTALDLRCVHLHSRPCRKYQRPESAGPGAAETTSKLLVALHNWKFRRLRGAMNRWK